MIPIELDRPRCFKYGMRALDILEKKLGHGVASLDLDNLTMQQLSVVMWAGLAHEDREITPDQIIDLIDTHSSIGVAIAAMSQAFGEAFEGANPEKNVESPAPNRAQRRAAAKNSQ